MGMIVPKVSLRDLRVRHVDSSVWLKIGRFEYAECKRLEKHYKSLGFQVKIGAGLKSNNKEVIKDYMKPGPVTIARMC